MCNRTLYVIPLLIFSLLTSCKSFDNKLLEQKASFDKSVPPMKVVVNRESVIKLSSFISPDEVNQVLRQNLIFESNARNLYLSIIIRKVNFSRFEHLYEVLFLMVPVFFGAPMGTGTYTITLEAAIMKKDGRILKTYTSTGSDDEYFGGTGNFLLEDADGMKTTYIKALQSACKDLREQMKKDIQNINDLTK